MGPGFFYYHRGPDGPQIRRALLLLAISGLLAFSITTVGRTDGRCVRR